MTTCELKADVDERNADAFAAQWLAPQRSEKEICVTAVVVYCLGHA